MDAKLKALVLAAKTKLVEFWQGLCAFVSHNKTIFFVLIPLFLLAKFRDIVSGYLTYKSDKEVDADKKKNDSLEIEVKQANDQADALVKHAEATAADTKTVDENWDKK